MTEDPPVRRRALTRRDIIRRGAVVGGTIAGGVAVWKTPLVFSAEGSPGPASHGSPQEGRCETTYAIKFELDAACEALPAGKSETCLDIPPDTSNNGCNIGVTVEPGAGDKDDWLVHLPPLCELTQACAKCAKGEAEAEEPLAPEAVEEAPGGSDIGSHGTDGAPEIVEGAPETKQLLFQ